MTNLPIRQPTNPPHLEDQREVLGKSFQAFLSAAETYPRVLVREKPSALTFSATEIVYHMLDVELLWQRRIRGLLDGTMNKFQQMNPDKEARDKRYNEKPYEDGISELKQAREDTHIHSKYGELNTFGILKTIEEHDWTHTAQLERILGQVSQTKVHDTL